MWWIPWQHLPLQRFDIHVQTFLETDTEGVICHYINTAEQCLLVLKNRRPKAFATELRGGRHAYAP